MRRARMNPCVMCASDLYVFNTAKLYTECKACGEQLCRLICIITIISISIINIISIMNIIVSIIIIIMNSSSSIIIIISSNIISIIIII